ERTAQLEHQRLSVDLQGRLRRRRSARAGDGCGGRQQPGRLVGAAHSLGHRLGNGMSVAKKMSVGQLTMLTAVNMLGSGIVLLPTKLAEVGGISILSWLITATGSLALAYAFARCGMLSRKTGGMGGYAEYTFDVVQYQTGFAGSRSGDYCPIVDYHVRQLRWRQHYRQDRCRDCLGGNRAGGAGLDDWLVLVRQQHLCRRLESP
nr:hypothetical protein [Tanacetum cinerariifolium]